MTSDRPKDATRLTRRDLMKMAAAGAAALSTDALTARGAGAGPAPAVPLPARSGQAATPHAAALPREWTGHNRRLADYYRATGYPA
ncbi:MAG TPA: hypothetical protein VND92_05880, partial [Vicinamibacterales bacterium]|nr:hypothetical protein [Vicinamibacterales bacterium]